MDRWTALVETFALEAPVGALFARLARSRRPWVLGAVAAVVGSALTNPIVYELDVRWALDGEAPGHFHGSIFDWAWKIAILEVGAVLVETAGYAYLCKLTWPRALAVSAVVNAWSFGAGIALQALGWA